MSWVFVDSKDAAEGNINYSLDKFNVDPGGFANVLGWPNHARPKLLELLSSHIQNGRFATLPSRDEAIEAVRQSIQEGEAKDSWIIGGKISLLAVDDAGIHWIERGECRNPPR